MSLDDFLNTLNELIVRFPPRALHLVPAHVKVRTLRIQRRDVSDDVVDEVVRGVFVEADEAETNFGTCVKWRRYAITIQLGIRGQRRVGMPRHIDLRNDR